MADIESKILDLIAAQAHTDRATLARDTTLADLALDSMDFIETVFALEETFDISIPYNANRTDPGGVVLLTVGDVIDQVSALLAKDGKAADWAS